MVAESDSVVKMAYVIDALMVPRAIIKKVMRVLVENLFTSRPITKP